MLCFNYTMMATSSCVTSRHVHSHICTDTMKGQGVLQEESPDRAPQQPIAERTCDVPSSSLELWDEALSILYPLEILGTR